ncbi:MAG: F-box protein, partial [Endozoicomonas sp.]
MDIKINKATNCLAQDFSKIDLSGHNMRENTAQRSEANSPEGDSPLQWKIPNEIVLQIAGHLSFNDFQSLSLTCRRFSAVCNLKERLRKLALQFYGFTSSENAKIGNNEGYRFKYPIPPIPTNPEIKDDLLLRAYHRYTSNKYLTSLRNTQEACVATLNAPELHPVRVVMQIAACRRLVSISLMGDVQVWNPDKPAEQCEVILELKSRMEELVIPLTDGCLASACEPDFNDN